MPEFSTIATFVSLAAVASLLIVAAVSDIRNFIIPNEVVAAIVVIFPIYVLGADVSPSMSGWFGNIAGAAVLLFLGAGLFAAGIFGGGDAKLIAAVALWAGPLLLGQFLLLTAITGGVLAATFLVAKSTAKPAGESGTIENGNAKEIPYGVAISTGGLFVCWQLLAG